jgi:hypothetical protein
MAETCNRHSFEYAENVCCRCGLAFCHDCLVYPRGPKKPPFCVNCAITAAGVRSTARTPSNLSRREVKRRVREAKAMQQPQIQAHTEVVVPLADDRDFELTSKTSFDQGWAVSWDESRDPHPGYPEPVHVSWGSDPLDAPAPAPAPARVHDEAPPPPDPAPARSAAPASHAAAPIVADDAPARGAELPRLQPMELTRPHAPARPGGLPSVRPPLQQPAADTPRTRLSDVAPAGPKLARAAAPTPAPADAPAAPPPPSGRLRRKEAEPPAEEGTMLGWLDDLLGTDKNQGSAG